MSTYYDVLQLPKNASFEQIKNLEEEMTPFGFVDDGGGDIPTQITDSSGTTWRVGKAGEDLDMGWNF